MQSGLMDLHVMPLALRYGNDLTCRGGLWLGGVSGGVLQLFIRDEQYVNFLFLVTAVRYLHTRLEKQVQERKPQLEYRCLGKQTRT